MKIDQVVAKTKQAAGPYPGSASNMNARGIDEKKNPPIYKI